jgi:hypothetical protein
MRALLPYPIPRRHGRCCQCQTLLNAGVRYYTSLVLPTQENEGQRFDYCQKCGVDRLPEHQGNAKIFWQGKIPPKVIEESSIATAQKAIALLRELCASDREDATEQAYILALYLGRQRQLALRYREVLSDATVLLWYEVLTAGDMLAVTYVTPRPAAAADLQRQLAEYLAL